MSTNSKFEERIVNYYESLRSDQLQTELEAIAETMRETLLLRAVYEELTGTSIEISDHPQRLVRQTQSALRENAIEQVEELSSELASAVSEEHSRVAKQIQSEKHDLLDHLSGLEALNERIDRVNDDRLQQLRREITTLDEPSYRDDQDIEAQRSVIKNQVRDNVVEELEAVETALMEPFTQSTVQTYVSRLIDGDTVTLSAIEETDIAKLRGSELGAHLKLKLGGD